MDPYSSPYIIPTIIVNAFPHSFLSTREIMLRFRPEVADPAALFHDMALAAAAEWVKLGDRADHVTLTCSW